MSISFLSPLSLKLSLSLSLPVSAPALQKLCMHSNSPRSPLAHSFSSKSPPRRGARESFSQLGAAAAEELEATRAGRREATVNREPQRSGRCALPTGDENAPRGRRCRRGGGRRGLHAPGQVVGALGRLILLDQRGHDFSARCEKGNAPRGKMNERTQMVIQKQKTKTCLA